MAEGSNVEKLLKTLRRTPPERTGGQVVKDEVLAEIQKKRELGQITEDEADLLVGQRLDAIIAAEKTRQAEFTRHIMEKIEQLKKEHREDR